MRNFHNGSAATLADALVFYDMRFNTGFTPQESRSDCVFELALSGGAVPNHRPGYTEERPSLFDVITYTDKCLGSDCARRETSLHSRSPERQRRDHRQS